MARGRKGDGMSEKRCCVRVPGCERWVISSGAALANCDEAVGASSS